MASARAFLIPVLGLLLAISASAPAAPAPRKPLLMVGKQTLYQRALARPGAGLHANPDAASAVREVVPFSAFYVYARRQVNGGDWVEVGSDSHGKVRGWIPASDLIDWKQALTVAFRDPVGHDRVLLFRDRDSLKSLVSGLDLGAYERLYRQADSGDIAQESPVIGIQPRGHLDLREDFYLVPIQEHAEVFLGGEKALMLQVTTVPLRETPRAETRVAAAPEPAAKAPAPAPALASRSASSAPASQVPGAAAVPAPASAVPPLPAAPPPAAPPPKANAYRAGLVFVIDATLSMGPYIDRTREVVRKVYDALKSAGLTERVSLGLVAYRDDPAAVPGVEYLSRTFVNLDQGTTAESFFAHVDSLRPSSVSTRAFREDSFAGIKRALDEMKWEGFQGRYVVLITDAGPRPGRDPLGSTHLDTDALRQLALDKGVSLWVLHLLTPEGEKLKDHTSAAAQYRRLSDYPGIGDFYYGVKTGDVVDYGRVLETLTTQISHQVAAAEQVPEPHAPAQAAAPAPVQPPPAPAPAAPQPAQAPAPPQAAPAAPAAAPADPQLAALQEKVEKLGYALRMRYLQRDKGGQVPTVFNAWLLDRDFRNPDRATLDVRVLLTRDQLSDLHQVLKQVLERAEEGLLSPRGFIDDLQSLAATLSRDPARVGGSTQAAGADNLADLGYMREYIEDLPYTGEVMDLSLEGWEDWPAKRQLEFLHRLENKIAYYQALHDHTDLWISLGGGPVTGDSVFPVPLEMLP